MSQVGLGERSAKDKTESKQLKSVKRFIARSQAKVDAKLTQSRLLPTLLPAKRENDPFHPSLDLSLFPRHVRKARHPMSYQTMNNPKMSQKNSSHSPRQRLTPPKEKGPKNHNIKSKRPHRQPTPRR